MDDKKNIFQAKNKFICESREIEMFRDLHVGGSAPNGGDYLNACIDEVQCLENEINIPKIVLDISCGLGRSSIYFNKFFNLKNTKFYLADFNSHIWRKNNPNDTTPLGYHKSIQPIPFNNLELTRKFCYDNELSNFEIIDLATDEVSTLCDIDLVYSFHAVGYHWSIKEAIQKYDLEKITTDNAKFIFGVRNKEKLEKYSHFGKTYEAQEAVIENIKLYKKIEGSKAQDFWIYKKYIKE